MYFSPLRPWLHIEILRGRESPTRLPELAALAEKILCNRIEMISTVWLIMHLSHAVLVVLQNN